MNAAELKKRIEDLNLPKFQYIILAGGSMVMHGLRDKTQDLDLCVSEPVAKQLGLSNKKPNKDGYYELSDDVDVMVGMTKIASEPSSDGRYLCQKLDDILRFKKQRNLPKDQQDIDRIEEYFAQQGHS